MTNKKATENTNTAVFFAALRMTTKTEATTTTKATTTTSAKAGRSHTHPSR